MYRIRESCFFLFIQGMITPAAGTDHNKVGRCEMFLELICLASFVCWIFHKPAVILINIMWKRWLYANKQLVSLNWYLGFGIQS